LLVILQGLHVLCRNTSRVHKIKSLCRPCWILLALRWLCVRNAASTRSNWLWNPPELPHDAGLTPYREETTAWLDTV
jgi:hypothetical protein